MCGRERNSGMGEGRHGKSRSSCWKGTDSFLAVATSTSSSLDGTTRYAMMLPQTRQVCCSDQKSPPWKPRFDLSEFCDRKIP